MNTRQLATIAALVMCAALLMAGCGTGHGTPVPAGTDGRLATPQSAGNPAADAPQPEAVAVPEGVSPELYRLLAEQLLRELAEAGTARRTARAPVGYNNRVTDLSLSGSPGSYELTWTYVNIGDYNRDGAVSLADITPIAQSFNATAGSPGWDSASHADGNDDGIVSLADITPIAQNFRNTVGGYAVYGSNWAPDNTETSWVLLGSVATGNLVADGLEYTFSPGGEHNYYYVAPLDGEQAGHPSDYWVAGGLTTDVLRVTDVLPSGGKTGETVRFTAAVNDVATSTYSWNFGDGATPGTSNFVQPDVELAAAGTYYGTLTVTSPDSPPARFGFYYSVEEPLAITSVTPTAGETGREVTFSAEHNGGASIGYYWDFGGGAFPTASNDASPTVTLAAPGTYNARLVIQNDTPESADYEFTLTVLPQSGNVWPADPVHLAWLTTWYLDLPLLDSPNRVHQSAVEMNFADEVLVLVNQERAAEGLAPLAFDPHLEAVAQAHSRHLATDTFFAHDNPEGMTPWDRLDAIDPPFWGAGAENIAAGHDTPAEVMTAWMNSPGHRANILKDNIEYLGVGCWYSEDSQHDYYWTQLFVGSMNASGHDWIEPGESPPE